MNSQSIVGASGFCRYGISNELLISTFLPVWTPNRQPNTRGAVATPGSRLAFTRVWCSLILISTSWKQQRITSTRLSCMSVRITSIRRTHKFVCRKRHIPSQVPEETHTYLHATAWTTIWWEGGQQLYEGKQRPQIASFQLPDEAWTPNPKSCASLLPQRPF